VSTDLRQGVAEVGQLLDPIAADRMPGIAQDAVDGLDVVLVPGQDNHRNGA
jgi:hypothetical protein